MQVGWFICCCCFLKISTFFYSVKREWLERTVNEWLEQLAQWARKDNASLPWSQFIELLAGGSVRMRSIWLLLLLYIRRSPSFLPPFLPPFLPNSPPLRPSLKSPCSLPSPNCCMLSRLGNVNWFLFKMDWLRLHTDEMAIVCYYNYLCLLEKQQQQ